DVALFKRRFGYDLVLKSAQRLESHVDGFVAVQVQTRQLARDRAHLIRRKESVCGQWFQKNLVPENVGFVLNRPDSKVVSRGRNHLRSPAIAFAPADA